MNTKCHEIQCTHITTPKEKKIKEYVKISLRFRIKKLKERNLLEQEKVNVEFFDTAVGCGPNKRKVSGRRGAAYGYNNSRAMYVPASTETPEVPSGHAQLSIEHQTDNILYQADMGLYDGLVGIMLSNE
ncbi:hypothetical protein AVEN_164015-1 [Araneus ventricosus]|uniref:Uncharacterized protein n=1 Tax=Araneus ventricosus TaxID=182803 RepID=A0A4Y2DBP6_ARAVE|nr:hypothetical protein AVEN_164015-1 [Araneus ventricosus]